MAKIINSKKAETIHTVELTQKELNTLALLVGCKSSYDFEELVESRKDRYIREELVETKGTDELYQLYEALVERTTHLKHRERWC